MSDRNWQSVSSTDISATGNWSGNAALATGDTGILNGIGTAALATGLAYATNILGCTLHVFDSFTATMGLEASGTNLASYFKLGTSGGSTINIGRNVGGPRGNGSSMLLIDGNTGTQTVNVYKTGSPVGSYPPLCLIGTGVTLNAYGGSTGFAVRPGETGTLIALSLLQNDNSAAPEVRCGKGTTYPATVRVEYGDLRSLSSNGITTLKVSGEKGKFISEVESTGAVTTATLTDGGIMVVKGTGAVTTVNLGAGCTLDYTQDARAKTLDAVTAYKGSKVLLDNGISSSITHASGGTFVTVITCPDGIGTVEITAPAGMALKIQ
jgi:hypothetical protein